MIYKGFNENEIKKIKAILDECHVRYEVSVYQEAVDHIAQTNRDDAFRARKGAHFDNSFLQIEIRAEEFLKISSPLKERLHALRIFEEAEVPFTEEELRSMGEPDLLMVNRKPEGASRAHQVFLIVSAAVIGLLWLWSKGRLKF